MMAFFLGMIKICQKDIVENLSKILVLKKNLNLILKREEKLKKKSKKNQINHKFCKLFKPDMIFFKF